MFSYNYKNIALIEPKINVISQLTGVVHGEGVGKIKIIPDVLLGFKDLYDLKEDEIVVVPYYPTEDPTFSRPMGIISCNEPAKMSHAELRARQWKIPHAVIPNMDQLKHYEGKWVYFKVTKEGVEFRLANPDEISNWESYKVKPETPVLAQVDLSTPKNLVRVLESADPAVISHKFASLKTVHDNSEKEHPSIGLMNPFPRTIGGFVLPYAMYKRVLDRNIGAEERIRQIALSIETDDLGGLSWKLRQIRKIIEELDIPDDIWGNAENENPGIDEEWSIDYSLKAELFFGGVFVRTGTNAEDLPDYPGFGAGQYGTFGNITKRDEVKKYVKKAWASVWSQGAYIERQKFGLDHFQVYPAVQICRAIDSKYSFVIHTADPDGGNTNFVYIEIVEGQGEGLVSEKHPGKAHLYIYDKTKEQIVGYKEADKKERVVLNPEGETRVEPTDYSEDIFSIDREKSQLALKIARAAVRIEKAFGRPQDIEGSIDWDDHNKQFRTWVLQSRSQVGVERNPSPWEDFYRSHIDWAHEMISHAEELFSDPFSRAAGNFVYTRLIIEFKKSDSRPSIHSNRIDLLSKLVKLFYSLGPGGHEVLKLMMLHSFGIHAYFINALDNLGEDLIAKIMDLACADVSKISRDDYQLFCEECGFLFSGLIERLEWHKDTNSDARKILKLINPRTLVAIINEMERYYYDSIAWQSTTRYLARKRIVPKEEAQRKKKIRTLFGDIISQLSAEDRKIIFEGLSIKSFEWLSIELTKERV